MRDAAVVRTRSPMMFGMADATVAAIGRLVVWLGPARRGVHDVAVRVDVMPIVARVRFGLRHLARQRN